MQRFSQAVPMLVGLLLLAAAVLKADGLLVEEALHDGLLGNRWLISAAVVGELILAAWLLSGVFARRCHHVTLSIFGLFAMVALAKGVTGQASCGCFGRFEVNPWWTLVLDLGVIGSLWASLRTVRPVENAAPASASAAMHSHGRMPLARPILATALSLLVAVPTTTRMLGTQSASMDADGVIVASGDLVILEPEKWIGKPLPIAAHIDIGRQLTSGRWTLVFYHHDCPKCQEVMPQYVPKRAMEAAAGARANRPRVA